MGSTLKVQYAAARLRHASKFTLFDWEGPQRIPGEQNHTSLYTYLLGGESWQSCRLLQEIADEITQVGTEALNNWFHTAKVLQSMKVLMWKHCWVDNLFVRTKHIFQRSTTPSTHKYHIHGPVHHHRVQAVGRHSPLHGDLAGHEIRISMILNFQYSTTSWYVCISLHIKFQPSSAKKQNRGHTQAKQHTGLKFAKAHRSLWHGTN